MPTENRSSNTEIATDQLPPCSDDVFKNGVSVCLVGDVPKHAAETICQSLSGVTGWKIDWHYIGGRTHIMALAQPAEQFQGEPGGYPPCDYCGIVPDHHPWHGSGLLSGVENRHIHACDACRGRLPLHPGQHKGEPVMRLECEKLLDGDGEYAVDFVKPGWLKECREKGGTFLLYTHADADADAGEAERPSQIALSLQAKLKSVESERDRLRAKLAEQEHSARELLRIIGMSVQGSAAYNRAVIAFHDSLNAATKPN